MTGYVYAMLSCDRVKIGYSERPKQRLNDANTMSPFKVEMLGYYEATFQDEQDLHKKFYEFRLHGEWFAYSGPVKKWADKIKCTSRDEPTAIDTTFLPTANLQSRLIKARKAAGFKKAAGAARHIGVNYQTYISHEDGSRAPKAEFITRYANAFGVSFMWLLYGVSSSQEPAE
jgi:DNA-binding XRE family transcriptional regulator